MYLPIAQRNRIVDAITARCNSGIIQCRTGARPANGDTADSGTLLGTLTFGSTAFGASSNGTATANAISQDSSADADGTVGHVSVYESNGTTLVGYFTAGTSGAEFNFNTLAVSTGQPISCTSATISCPGGA